MLFRSVGSCHKLHQKIYKKLVILVGFIFSSHLVEEQQNATREFPLNFFVASYAVYFLTIAATVDDEDDDGDEDMPGMDD